MESKGAHRCSSKAPTAVVVVVDVVVVVVVVVGGWSWRGGM